jgi:hypothetical protein
MSDSEGNSHKHSKHRHSKHSNSKHSKHSRHSIRHAKEIIINVQGCSSHGDCCKKECNNCINNQGNYNPSVTYQKCDVVYVQDAFNTVGGTYQFNGPGTSTNIDPRFSPLWQLISQDGTNGFQGFTGPNGFQGFTGPNGFQGFTGFNGLQGFTGFNGLQGFTGFNGLQGFTGPNGFQGFTGFNGLQGFTGFNGTNGFQGFTGPNGFQGITGPITTTNSITFYSTTVQNIFYYATENSFTNVSLEQTPIKTITSTWSINSSTNMVSSISGYFLISYKLDIYFADNATNVYTVAVKMTLNGTDIKQSTSYVTSLNSSNSIYTVNSTFLLNYTTNDSLILQVASSGQNTPYATIGTTSPPPGGITFNNMTETTALVTIVQIA